MCEFFSAIAMRGGTIQWHPATDSHADLLDWFGLKDTMLSPRARAWAPVEFTPKEYLLGSERYAGKADRRYDRLDSYGLELPNDEDCPKWVREEQDLIIESLRHAVSGMIVNGRREMLLGGVWILGEDAYVDYVANARIIAMYGTARIYSVKGNSQIGVLRDDSRIECMRGDSTVQLALGNSAIGQLADYARVESLTENARIDILYGQSCVQGVYLSARIMEDVRAPEWRRGASVTFQEGGA